MAKGPQLATTGLTGTGEAVGRPCFVTGLSFTGACVIQLRDGGAGGTVVGTYAGLANVPYHIPVAGMGHEFKSTLYVTFVSGTGPVTIQYN